MNSLAMDAGSLWPKFENADIIFTSEQSYNPL
jgi:hypothetical protein